jgi:hypothetical protein
LGFGIRPSFKDRFLSRRAKPWRHESATCASLQVIEKTSKYLTEVGRHVDTLLRRCTAGAEQLRPRLWDYVAQVSSHAHLGALNHSLATL